MPVALALSRSYWGLSAGPWWGLSHIQSVCTPGSRAQGMSPPGPLTLCVFDCPPVSPEPSAVFAKEQPARSEVQAKAGGSATLSCEVAQAGTEVTWYKDGKKLSASSRVHVEAQGCSRRLVVQQAGRADAGEYSCEAGGQKVSFRMDVTGKCLEGDKP
uniref:Ig-like domain-containing protein n=2 Tax=Canis lupus familiaris TaxID=9615 RepID=A0A8I3NI42_CANLF